MRMAYFVIVVLLTYDSTAQASNASRRDAETAAAATAVQFVSRFPDMLKQAESICQCKKGSESGWGWAAESSGMHWNGCAWVEWNGTYRCYKWDGNWLYSYETTTKTGKL
jgi:hypothetical protein